MNSHIPSKQLNPNSCQAVTVCLILLTAFLAAGQPTVSDPAYTVTDRGAFYRVWQRTVLVTNSLTLQVTQEVQSYTELGDGMHYWNNGAWAESQDLVEVTSNGAQAVHGQMKANSNSDITSVGAITLTTGSEVFKSHPLGLFYFDYTGLAYYGGYFYPAWADNSNTTGDNPDFLQGHNEMDVYVARIKY